MIRLSSKELASTPNHLITVVGIQSKPPSLCLGTFRWQGRVEEERKLALDRQVKNLHLKYFFILVSSARAGTMCIM